MKKRIKKKIHKYIKQYISENNMVRLCDVNRPHVTIHNPSLKIDSRVEISSAHMGVFDQITDYKDNFLEYHKEKILYNLTKNKDFRNSVVYETDKNPVNGNYIITGRIEIYNPNMN